MEASYVNVDENYLGKIVAEDIFANTQNPIVTKNSVITPQLLHVFKVFKVSEVLILKEQQQLDNEITDKDSINIKEPTVTITHNLFKTHYQEAVYQFKKEFLSWESLVKVDIVKIRGIILPLVEKFLGDRTILFNLNDYSNPNEYTYHHSIATGLICAAIAQKLGYDKGTILQMAIAGTLADSGMSKIPSRIRDKKSALLQTEFTEIRKHPVYSYQMVRDLPALKDNMKQAILEHHERLDGSGYPRGLKIDNISPFSQIIAVADMFHAMTSERNYRAKESPFKVVEMIKENEFGKFDIRVVQALMDLVVDLPIGMKVELSNLERGEVMFINKYSPTRPLVKLLKTSEIVDLSNNRNLYIVRIITN